MKGQRRALAQQLAQEEPKVKLPKLEESDMLVVNPTHFAVALYYRPGETPLPLLVSKGTDDDARALIARCQSGRCTGDPVRVVGPYAVPEQAGGDHSS